MTNASRLAAALAGRYRLERELGAGGMATVYLAEDLKHKRKVALKVLKPELAAVLGAERFVQEITTTAALQHPHILPLFDSGTAGQRDGGTEFLYYVMPFIDGETLRSKLDRETQLGIEEAVRIASDVASALHYAHQHGVIHRDIKPENILLHEGRPMVADFGIALAVSAAAGGRMTETGLSLGTPHYMSPEQATAEKEITGRSDVYSLASVLFEMLTGQPPHLGGSAQQVIMKIVTEEAVAVTRLRKSVPPNVAAAVAKALEKLPADRFASAREFAEALATPGFAFRSGASASAGGVGTPGSWNRVTLAMAGVATALGVLLVASMVRRSGDMVGDAPVVRFALSDDPALRFVTHVSAPFGISPDGRTVVFSAADAAGRIALWVRTLDDPNARLLQGTDDGTHPVISPDGEWVAYIGGSQTLMKVRLAGGTPTMLAELPGVSASLSWESNDAILSEVIAPSGEIQRVSANGGVPVVAVPFDSAAGEVRQRRPLVLRQGRMVLYVGTTRHDSSALVMYSLPDRRRARLNVNGAPLAVIGDLLVYASDGALSAVAIDVAGMRLTGDPVRLSQRAASKQTGTAVALSETGTLVYEDGAGQANSRLELVDQAGRRTRLGGEEQFAAPRYSPDGSRIAVVIQADIWVIDLASGERTRVTNTGRADVPEWSPGGRLTYVATVRGERQVWSTPLDGSAAPARLVEVEGDVVSAVPTPDGRSVIVSRWARGDARIELLRVGLDRASRIDTLVSPSGPGDPRPISPRVSPNGRLVAFADRSRRTVHVRSLDGTGAIQVSTDGGCCPHWAADSRRVFFRNADRLVAVDLQTAPALAVVGRTSAPGFWANDLIATTYEDVQYDLSPDGRTFVAVTPISHAIRVSAAFNWAAELKREWQAGGRR